MKVTIPEISWHNRDPVLSIDIQTKSDEQNKGENFWRLATGGADSHILVSTNKYKIVIKFNMSNVCSL